MKKPFEAFIGIDVSKMTLDACLLKKQEKKGAHHVFPNTAKGVTMLVKWVGKYVASAEDCLFCLEHTGIYAYPLCRHLGESQCSYAMVPALEIIKSMGIRRGKTDKADALTIAKYAQLRQDELVLYSLPEKKLMKIKQLLTQRNLLVKTRKAFSVALTETEGFLEKEITKEINAQNKLLLASLDKKILQVDELIRELIKSDQHMLEIFKLLLGIPGVGPNIAAYLLVYTRCFTLFQNSRKFACYCGIAPFEYQSGTSIRGRRKVSHLANKKLKTLLNMAALTAKRTDVQIRLYYDRKVAEGKNPMLVLNNIRNKIAGRIFATIQRGTPYVHTMQFAA